jgi:hypothetical protein
MSEVLDDGLGNLVRCIDHSCFINLLTKALSLKGRVFAAYRNKSKARSSALNETLTKSHLGARKIMSERVTWKQWV